MIVSVTVAVLVGVVWKAVVLGESVVVAPSATLDVNLSPTLVSKDPLPSKNSASKVPVL